MTPLKSEIMRQIARSGPITIAEYMAQCLLHPDHGYYTSQKPFGKKGDFVTAPEISQMFGEMVGLALGQAWIDQGSPQTFNLVEIGPGRGTLMADILRVTKQIPGFLQAARITLVEASPKLREIQRQNLNGFAITHLETLSDIPSGPVFLVANEYLDCLPIHQFAKREGAWHEVMVGADSKDLHLMLGTKQGWAAEGEFVETCPAALAIMMDVDQLIAREGGAALFIDYGHNGDHHDSLQSVQNHQKLHPLAAPGISDLTAHVDFKPLHGVIEHCKPSRITEQGVFLERLGITKRAQQLLNKLEGPARENHIAAHRRLTHPDEMGRLFKVLGFVPESAPMIAGLSK